MGDLLDKGGEPLTEENELWIRDPVECIRELIGNLAFCDHIAYVCQEVFTDEKGENRRYDEMWTGEWWWKTQASPIFTITCCQCSNILLTLITYVWLLIVVEVANRCRVGTCHSGI